MNAISSPAATPSFSLSLTAPDRLISLVCWPLIPERETSRLTEKGAVDQTEVGVQAQLKRP